VNLTSPHYTTAPVCYFRFGWVVRVCVCVHGALLYYPHYLSARRVTRFNAFYAHTKYKSAGSADARAPSCHHFSSSAVIYQKYIRALHPTTATVHKYSSASNVSLQGTTSTHLPTHGHKTQRIYYAERKSPLTVASICCYIYANYCLPIITWKCALCERSVWVCLVCPRDERWKYSACRAIQIYGFNERVLFVQIRTGCHPALFYGVAVHSTHCNYTQVQICYAKERPCLGRRSSQLGICGEKAEDKSGELEQAMN
jgi:hypothetical protein